MADYEVMVMLQSTTGLAEDVVTNRFHIATPAPAHAAADLLGVGLIFSRFYNEATPAGETGVGVGHFLAQSVRRGLGVHEIRFYAAGQIGSPVLSYPMSLQLNPVANALPSEVAAVLSYRGSYEAVAEFGPEVPPPGVRQRPRARRRNRVFIGPLSEEARTMVGVWARPSTVFRNTVLASFDRLVGDLRGVGAGYSLVVRSDTAGTQVPPVEAWMDDAFDTVRSRGVDPTARILRDVTD